MIESYRKHGLTHCLTRTLSRLLGLEKRKTQNNDRYWISTLLLGCYSGLVKRISTGVIFTLILTTLIAVSPQAPAQAGLFDCVKPKKWASYSKLRTAYLKESKTEDDWFKSYIFARIYTGSSKCFNSKDVAVMKKFVSAYNQACMNNPSWNYSCKLYSGSSTFASWVYEGYK